AASLGLDDVAFAINAAPHVGNIQSSLARYIDKRHRRGWRRVGNGSGLKSDAVAPLPKRRGKRVEESAAENNKGRAQKMPSGKGHRASLIIARECNGSRSAHCSISNSC